jgi:hypothetical protein
MIAKALKLAALLVVGAVTLTACTPPMPPEVAAALAEQTYVCIDGDVTLSTPGALADDLPSITDSMTGNCPTMTATSVEPGSDGVGSAAQIFIDSAAPAAAVCTPSYTTPFALDAAVVSVTLGDSAGVILSPASVAGIFDGSIKTWDSPKLAADNSGEQVGSGPIYVLPITDAKALKAFSAWYQNLTGKAFNAPLIKAKRDLSVADLGTLAEGTVALLPYSTFTAYSTYSEVIPLAANILADKKAPEGVTADSSGIISAGTQLQLTKTASGITVKMDYSAKPVPPLGSDIAPVPYGAIYPVNLNLCGKPSMLARAVARFMLRQDSQGTLTAFVSLPENLRAESLIGVSKGLPTPKAKPQQ